MKTSYINLLLIQPWIFDIAAYDLWIKPIGLLYLAEILEKAGFNIFLLDCLNPYHPKIRNKLNRKTDGRGKFYREIIDKPKVYKNIPRNYAKYGLPEKIVREELEKLNKIDAILITSMMTYWYPGVKQIADICREYFPKAPIILGGVYASLMPEHCWKTIMPNSIIIGPGEKNIIIELQKIFPDLEKIDSNNKEIYPAWHLTSPMIYLPILTSRGCPYKCTYCASYKLFPFFYQRKPEDVVKEILYFYEKYSFKDIVFYDDALLINSKNHLLKILNSLKERNLHFSFHTPNGINARLIDDELAEAMYVAHFKTIRISLETTNEEWQKNTGRKVSNAEFSKAMKSLFKAGYKQGEIEVYLLAGMPQQTISEVNESIKFVQDNGGIVRLSLYSPIPNTEDFLKLPKSIQNQLIEEPLLQNNSVFSFIFNYFSYEEYEKIKEKV